MAASFDFRTLSPLDFEELVHDALEALWQLRLEAFGPGRDQGIDLRYLNGSQNVIVQAKHMVDSGYSNLLRAVREEREKALRLAPTRYVLATSVALNSARKNEIIAAMTGVPLVEADILGQTELNAILRAHEGLVRRHFKLWLSSTAVLERILHSGVYNRTAAELDVIKAMVPRFVQNQSVDDALRRLAETGALIVAGAPGVGKTTLARILLWLHAEQGWNIYVVDSLDDAFKVAASTERRLILLDDFLGQVRLSADHVRGIDARLPPLISRVAAHDNLRFILTTRDYILAQARSLSAKLAPGKMHAREYVLNVGTYTRAVKAQILYNHIYFSALTSDQRAALLHDDFFLKIIDHDNFNPRLIEEVTAPEYLALTDSPIRQTVEAVLGSPELLWERPYRQHIREEGRMLMLALAINGSSAAPSTLKDSYARVSRALGKALHPADIETSFRSTFKALDGSAIGLFHRVTIFTNPGLRDYLQNVLLNDKLIPLLLPEIATAAELRELWSIFLSGKPTASEKTLIAEAWTAALDRVDAAGSIHLCDYLMFATDLAAELKYDPLFDRVELSINALEDTALSEEEVSDICALLEKSQMCSLPPDLETRFQAAVTNAAAELMIEHGNSMSFEDMQSLDESLHSYGSDKQIATVASHEAMSAIAKNIRFFLSDIETIDDLDEFEDNVTSFMRKRSFPTFSVVSDINRHRERLADEGRLERRESYSGGRPFLDKSMSDSDIRSMFRSLNRDQS